MRGQPFRLQTFCAVWFLVYFVVRQAAMFGHLYALTAIELGKSLAILGSVAIVFANLFGLLMLGEVLSVSTYLGVMLAVVAFLVIAIF
jgi:multidrug transporter EmrE-like cation transporter